MRRHFDSRVTRLARILIRQGPRQNLGAFAGAADFTRRHKLLIRRYRPDTVSNGNDPSMKK
jgi:hypothetical protein